MIREVLYNVPPFYHLDHEEWKKYQHDIVNHHKIWSEFSRKAIQEEMTGFLYLKEDGSVQKTIFGNELSAVANFGEISYVYENTEIPPHSWERLAIFLLFQSQSSFLLTLVLIRQ